MKPKNEVQPLTTFWNISRRGKPSYQGNCPRLEESSYGSELFNWLVTGVPDLTKIYLHMFGSSDGQPGSQIDLIRDDEGIFVTAYCGVKVSPLGENLLPERLSEFATITQVFKRLADYLNIQSPPDIRLQPDEEHWLHSNGYPPIVNIGKCPIKLSGRSYPIERSILPSSFDVWELFTGDSKSPLTNFSTSVRDLTDIETRRAAEAINWHIESYFDRLSEVGQGVGLTDSEAIHAAALMCGGQELWMNVMEYPVKYRNVWPVNDEAESILVFSEWT